jgi:hypothetical protein
MNLNKKKFNEIKKLIDFKVDYEDILLKSKGNGNYLVVDNILLKEEYQNKKSVELFKKTLIKYLNKHEYLDIIASSVNEFEADVLKAAGFIEYKKIKDGVLYIKKD